MSEFSNIRYNRLQPVTTDPITLGRSDRFQPKSVLSHSAVVSMMQKSKFQEGILTITFLLAEKGPENKKSYSGSPGCNGTPPQFNTPNKE